MKHVTFPAGGAASVAIAPSGKESKRIGFFARFVEALHHSRRIQARRYLIAHRDLLADDGASLLQSKAGDEK